MISTETKTTLEKRYACKISIDYLHETYRIFSLDGCPWDCAGSYRALVKTLAEDKAALKRIADGRKARLAAK